MKINQLFCLPRFSISKIEYSINTVKVFASIKTKRSQCPSCGKYSRSIHDYYYRSITDLQVFQNASVIILKARKFRCRNPKCHRKVFSEQTGSVLRYSRRTTRACKISDSFSIELTGKLGSQLSKQIFLGVSISTITRIAHNQQLPVIKQPRVLGVDDWAFRKGVRFGTVLIDMETSRPIDLLLTRESADLKTWLTKYPGAEILTRDRSSSYSAAINEVCPDAIQIADLFHLLMNLTDALDTYFKSITKEIRKVIKDKADEILKMAAKADLQKKINTDLLSVPVASVSKEIKVDQRLDTFSRVKELQLKGTPLKRISKVLGISRNTVKSYYIQETLVPRSHPRSINIEQFTGYILTRLTVEGLKKKDIFDEIVQLGYTGGSTQAYSYIRKTQSEYGISTLNHVEFQQKMIPYIKPLSSRKLAKYIGGSLSDIEDPDERCCMKTLIENYPELQIVRKLVQIFRTMLKRGCGNIRRWIDFVKRSKHRLSGIKVFANGLLRDIQAVENGIFMSWSNGTVEGHINRIKSIKRRMYGRAGFELLRRKVILSQTG
ncbi:MAG: ISL3 family transposase [Porphyromonadaceae bacterium]|nr:MAG: ISL3 family transposase [Porphyromonadaceae bacterium]